MLAAIISRVLSNPGCHKLLIGDGITVSELSITAIAGVIEAASADIRSARKTLPAIGTSASIAKNLDEYQYRICLLVPSLADSDPRKIQIQKYRAATIAAFAMLATILKNPGQARLEEWNAHAGPLMEEMSEGFLKAKSNSKLQIHRKDTFEFFKVPDDQLEHALAAFYGQ